MPVIGVDQVPREIVRPKWYEDLGYAQGALARAIFLSMVGGGQVGQKPTTPTPGNPGSLTFPSGATTRTSPQELAQIQQMGGVPTRQGQITPMGQPSTGGVSYQVPTRLGIKPNLAYEQAQADLDYKRAQTNSLTPEFQADQYRRMLGLPPLGQDQGQGQDQPTDNELSTQLRALYQESEKETATGQDGPNTTRLRLVLKLLRGE